MPRIKDDFLDCAVYLYHSRDDADAGTDAGGSGFLVEAKRRADVDLCITNLYAVTNKHVIKDGAYTIRLNTRAGKTDILCPDESDWRCDPGHDIAVCPIKIAEAAHKFRCVDLLSFTMKEHVGPVIGIGDDVFLVGRFITQDGKQQNRPSLRFGNISVLPWEPIDEHREAFLVEVHSIAGYSGSPVFVYIMDFKKMAEGKEDWCIQKLLGIDVGHKRDSEPILARLKTGDWQELDGFASTENTGMAIVIPAWVLAEFIINDPVLDAAREQQAEAERKKRALRKSRLD